MTTVKTFTFNGFQVNTYIIYDETKEAVIIDPACENQEELSYLVDFIDTEQLNPVAIANTHGHIDHIVGVDLVRNKFNIPFMIHPGESPLLSSAPQSAMLFGFDLGSPPEVNDFIDENKSLNFGNSQLKLYHVPGHSPGSLVYHDPAGSYIIAGDVLFNGSIGRTDLPGGSYEDLISGIKEKLLTLPDNTTVYCGHGPSTSIRKEKDTNPFLI